MSKTLRTLALAGLLSSASHASLAADNPLSVHILDLQTGEPTSGVTVDLDQNTPSGWRKLASGVTDSQGRIRALFPTEAKFSAGEYRVVFHTGEHYAALKQKTFFPHVEVPFNVDDVSRHYHIPLLMSPYGYSTYRGN